MNTYKVEDFTFGVELEIADVDTRIKLPEGNNWDFKDYTIANSCGVCNDPKKKTTIFGGEINTKPTSTTEDQLSNIAEIFKFLGEKKSINHTCNLHIHVGVPGLREDLDSLKKLVFYIYKYQEEAFNIVEELIEPNQNDFKSKEEFKGAKKRFNRRKVSHQKKLSKNILDKMLVSNNIDEFFQSFAPKGDNGEIFWGTVTRCGINILQMYNETHTVEFRHFPMTFDLDEIYSSLEWCKLFMEAVLITGKTPTQIFDENDWMIFPKFADYNHKIQKILELTSVGKLKRSEVEVNIKNLLEQGLIKTTDLYD